MSSEATRAPGTKLTERYTLTRIIGRGGMATVWEAFNEARQPVAIKLLNAGLLEDQENIARFFLEARNASRITHPGVVRVLDTGQAADGAPFLVLELLEGMPLDVFIQKHQRFSISEASAVLVPMLDALAAAHAAGVIHRDLKPGNVFISLGTSRPCVKILDFGISRALGNDTRLTQTGAMFGTPAYMSPEQVQGTKGVGAASDLYSVGAMAFELLAGRPPFDAPNPLALAAIVLTTNAPALSSVRPELPAALGALIDAALQREPTARPVDAQTFRRQLESLAPPNAPWLFSRAKALLAETNDAPVATRPAAPRSPGLELTLAALEEKLATSERRLPAPIAVRALYDVLLDPASPNVFTPSQVRIGPTGLVRAIAGAPKRSVRGATLHTSLPPEAWVDQPTAASAQFCAATTLVRVLLGEDMYAAPTEAALLESLKRGPRLEVLERLPAPLRVPIGRMLAADPQHRFADLGTCASELAAPFRTSPLFSRAHDELAAMSRLPGASQPRLVPVADSPPARGISLVGILAVVALIALGAFTVWRSLTREPELTPPTPTLVDDTPLPDALEPPTPVVAVAKKSDYRITTEPPGAALWVNGEFQGNAPGQLTLEGTTMQLRAVLPAYDVQELTLTPDDLPHEVTLTLHTSKILGTVRFDVPDHVRIWLDGTLVAQGLVVLPLESVVPHTFQLEAKGRRSPERTFTIRSGEEKILRFGE